MHDLSSLNNDHNKESLALYVHWPFCVSKCPYCDFNSHVRDTIDEAQWKSALLTDMAYEAALNPNRKLSSIFFGGGTPSLMKPDQIEHLIDACQTHFALAPACEITLEANPNNVTRALAKTWHSLGINRLSIGLQSLNDQALTFLGRDHNSAHAQEAAEIAADIFASFSIDMIYARPGQTLSDWESELEAALKLGAPHLSLYELTIAPGTAFAKATARGTLTPLPDNLQADMYELTQRLTQSAGLTAYEISNHASAPAHRSKHNTIYWQSGDWIGLGPGAHGRLTQGGIRIATEAHAKPDDYIHAVNTRASGLSTHAPLSKEDTLQELVTMGLRQASGIDITRLEGLSEQGLNLEKLAHLRAHDWLTHSPDTLALTLAGRLLADRIALELLS